MKNRDLLERLMYVTLALVFVVVGILVVLQGQANNRLQAQQKILQEQVAGQKEVLEGVKTLLANQGKTTEEINKSLSCILVFFTTPQRTSYYISDLTTCTITNMNSGETKVLPLPKSTPQATQNNSTGGSQGSPSVSQGGGQTATPPSNGSQNGNPQPQMQNVQEFLNNTLNDNLNNTTDLTCGVLGVLCRQ